MIRGLVALSAIAALLLPACKGKGDDADPPSTKPVGGTSAPTEPAAPARPGVPNNPPTLELPAYEFVGVGQEIGFGIEVVDEESDTIAVELLEKPDSATFDHPTLTVVWKPTKADMPHGRFKVKITETRKDGGESRAAVHDFSIGVTAAPQPLPRAQPLGPAVETLITIHDQDRLAKVNADWPIDVLLERAAQSTKSDHGDKDKAEVPDKKALYDSFLRSMAAAHANPTVDPTSDKFDAATWADPKGWKIIALRPRLDKKWHELRIVYKAKAHAATYAMFKFRPYAASAVPQDDSGIAANNKQFAGLVLEAFFTKDGKLDPALFTDKRAHAERAAQLMKKVVEFDSSDQPWPTATFLGLPMEARLGGGTVRDDSGAYVSGDAWGWHVMKVKPKDGKYALVNIPIKGFTTAVAPTADGTRWKMACGAQFGAGTVAAPLCRNSGHVDLPSTGDGYQPVELSNLAKGKVVSSLVDAAHLHREYKAAMESDIDLHDPRRDLFEEKGMTCHQCHVRKFGVRDMSDRAAYDPRAGVPKALNKKQNTTYFVITPTERWQPYAIDFQHKQECKFKVAIKKATGVDTDLICPLLADR